MKTLTQLLLLFKSWFNPATENNPRLILYRAALDYLEIDATPEDHIPDEVACAETINAIYEQAFGVPIGGGVSTYRMYRTLKESPLWEKVSEPLEGDLVISPTGYGDIKVMPGHVGIVSELPKIMANDSDDGIFKEKYTLASWKERWEKRGKYPVYFYRRV